MAAAGDTDMQDQGSDNEDCVEFLNEVGYEDIGCSHVQPSLRPVVRILSI